MSDIQNTEKPNEKVPSKVAGIICGAVAVIMALAATPILYQGAVPTEPIVLWYVVALALGFAACFLPGGRVFGFVAMPLAIFWLALLIFTSSSVRM